jgi:hypothetical protein
MNRISTVEPTNVDKPTKTTNGQQPCSMIVRLRIGEESLYPESWATYLPSREGQVRRLCPMASTTFQDIQTETVQVQELVVFLTRLDAEAQGNERMTDYKQLVSSNQLSACMNKLASESDLLLGKANDTGTLARCDCSHSRFRLGILLCRFQHLVAETW